MRFHVFPRSWQGYQDSCHWVNFHLFNCIRFSHLLKEVTQPSNCHCYSYYKAVFKALKEMIQLTQEVVVDYGKAFFKAVREFPDTKLKGCAFHANQAVYRKIELGIYTRYINDAGTNVICRKLMSLIYMPPDAMLPLFDRLKSKVKDEKLF